jgi:hypothetical protein
MLQISNFFIHGGKPGKILSSRFEALKLSRGKKCRKKASGAEDTKIAGWRVFKIPALARVSMGWELIRLEVIEIGGTVCATTGPDSAIGESGPETEVGEEGPGTEPKSYLNCKG